MSNLLHGQKRELIQQFCPQHTRMFIVRGLFLFIANKNLHITTISCGTQTLNEKYKSYKAKNNNYNVLTIDSKIQVTKSKITVDGKGVLNDANTAGTSKLDWRCFEYY